MRVLAAPGSALRFLNPYCHQLYSNMEAEVVEYSWRAALRGGYAIYHLHWPETELNTLGPIKACLQLWKKIVIIDYLRCRGTRVVWTIHNLQSHERRYPGIETWFFQRFTCRLDGLLLLSSSALGQATSAYPSLYGLPAFVTPHGHYRGEYACAIGRDEARARLGIRPAAKVLLTFGQIRTYKNVEVAIHSFRALAETDLTLLVVGQCRDAFLRARLLAGACEDPRIRLVLEHIPKDEVQLYMKAADLVILPYRNILNSGAALLALSFNCPVLVPDRGAMRELQVAVGESWVQLYSDELNATDLLAALQWASKGDRESIASLSSFDWPAIADQTLQAFNYIAVQPRRRM